MSFLLHTKTGAGTRGAAPVVWDDFPVRQMPDGRRQTAPCAAHGPARRVRRGYVPGAHFFLHLRGVGSVVGIQRSSHGGRHRNLIIGGLDFAHLHHRRPDAHQAQTLRQSGTQRVLPGFVIRGFLLGFDLAAFTQAFLPQSQRAGKGQVNMRVEALGVPYRQAAALEGTVHYPLQVQQRNVGGPAPLFKPDSHPGQSRALPAACWHRIRCIDGCRAASSRHAGPSDTRGSGKPC